MSETLKTLIVAKLTSCGIPALDGSTFREHHYTFSHGVRTTLIKGSMEIDIEGRKQQKVVVLKRINPRFAMNESPERIKRLLQYFEREAGVWRCTSTNANILELYGYMMGANEVFPSLVCPFFLEGDLREYVERRENKSLPAKQRIKLVCDIARGLDYLHKLSPLIVHRDIRARNVLVRADGQTLSAVIIDFGSAKLSDPRLFRILNTTTSHAEQWSPPEYILRGEHHINPTPKGDIWSLACTCLEVFTAKDPFPKFTDLEDLFAEGGMPPKPSEEEANINEMTWRFLSECWSMDPKKRPTAEQAVFTLENLGTTV